MGIVQFDLENDPYERDNLAYKSEHAPLLSEMQKRLEAQKYAINFSIPEKAKDVPDDELEEWRK